MRIVLLFLSISMTFALAEQTSDKRNTTAMFDFKVNYQAGKRLIEEENFERAAQQFVEIILVAQKEKEPKKYRDFSWLRLMELFSQHPELIAKMKLDKLVSNPEAKSSLFRVLRRFISERDSLPPALEVAVLDWFLVTGAPFPGDDELCGEPLEKLRDLIKGKAKEGLLELDRVYQGSYQRSRTLKLESIFPYWSSTKSRKSAFVAFLFQLARSLADTHPKQSALHYETSFRVSPTLRKANVLLSHWIDHEKLAPGEDDINLFLKEMDRLIPSKVEPSQARQTVICLSLVGFFLQPKKDPRYRLYLERAKELVPKAQHYFPFYDWISKCYREAGDIESADECQLLAVEAAVLHWKLWPPSETWIEKTLAKLKEDPRTVEKYAKRIEAIEKARKAK